MNFFQKKEGVARGPEIIRAARVIEELKTLGINNIMCIYIYI